MAEPNQTPKRSGVFLQSDVSSAVEQVLLEGAGHPPHLFLTCVIKALEAERKKHPEE